MKCILQCNLSSKFSTNWFSRESVRKQSRHASRLSWVRLQCITKIWIEHSINYLNWTVNIFYWEIGCSTMFWIWFCVKLNLFYWFVRLIPLCRAFAISIICNRCLFAFLFIALSKSQLVGMLICLQICTCVSVCLYCIFERNCLNLHTE